jgi:hypothetical protein
VEMIKNFPTSLSTSRSFFIHNGTWRHPNDDHFTAKFGLLFAETRHGRHRYVIADVAFTLLLSVLMSAMSFGSRETCVAQHALLAIGFGAQFVFLVALRPFDRLFHNVLAILIAFLEGLIALLVFGGSASGAGNYAGLQAAAFMILIILAVLIVKCVADLALYFLFFFDLADITAAKRDTTFEVPGQKRSGAAGSDTDESGGEGDTVSVHDMPYCDQSRILPLPSREEEDNSSSDNSQNGGLLTVPRILAQANNALAPDVSNGVGIQGAGGGTVVHAAALSQYIKRKKASETFQQAADPPPKTVAEMERRKLEKRNDFLRKHRPDPFADSSLLSDTRPDNSSSVFIETSPFIAEQRRKGAERQTLSFAGFEAPPSVYVPAQPAAAVSRSSDPLAAVYGNSGAPTVGSRRGATTMLSAEDQDLYDAL